MLTNPHVKCSRRKKKIKTEQPWQWSHFGMQEIERIKQKSFSDPLHATKQTGVFLSSVSQPLSYLHQSTALALSYTFVTLCGLFFYHPSLTWTYAPLIIMVRFHLGPLIKAEWRIGAWRTSLITAAGGDTHHLHQPFPVNIIIIIHHPPDQYSSTSAPVACGTLEWRHTSLCRNWKNEPERGNSIDSNPTNRLLLRNIEPFHKCQPRG